MKTASTAGGKRTTRRIVLLAYLAVVLGATLAPISGGAYEVVSGFDKLVHVGLFGGVAVLLSWNLAEFTARSAAAVFLSTTTFAAVIELIQGTLRYRSGDFWDLLAGAIGALMGVTAAGVLGRIFDRILGFPHSEEDSTCPNRRGS